jgi:hypothetical protein
MDKLIGYVIIFALSQYFMKEMCLTLILQTHVIEFLQNSFELWFEYNFMNLNYSGKEQFIPLLA